MSGDVLFITERDWIIGYAERYAVPAIYPYREDAVAGGLVSYGTSISESQAVSSIVKARKTGHVLVRTSGNRGAPKAE
jgi:hypothetical protein